MDYSIRPVNLSSVRPISQQRKRSDGGDQTPFDPRGELEQATDEAPPQPRRESPEDRARRDHLVAPLGEDDVGARVNLSA